ncbi:MAG: protease modulator HflC [Pseudomonadota bacterium]
MKKKKTIIFLITILFIILGFMSLFILPENEHAVITQFGKPVRTISTPGLYFKLPGFLQKINTLDKRTQILKTQAIQLLLGDKNPLIITTYVCYKIDKPVQFFQSLTTFEIAKEKLNDMVNSQLGSALGDYTIDNIINTNQAHVKIDEIENKIKENADLKTRANYGIQIVSVGISRITYPEIVAESVYARMRAERSKEAKKYRAEGEQEASKIEAQTDREVTEILALAYKESEIIKGEGDSQSMEIYASAYSKDPDFFEFTKSLQAYSEILKKKSTLILSTDSELFKYLDFKNKK